MAHALGVAVSQAHRLGGSDDWRDAELLQPAPPTPQAPEGPRTCSSGSTRRFKRRTRVVRIFPNSASCLRRVRALCAETHEGWLEDHRYLNMEFLKEQKKDVARLAA